MHRRAMVHFARLNAPYVAELQSNNSHRSYCGPWYFKARSHLMTVRPWETKKPDLVADVRLYSTDQGGKTTAARRGYGCPLYTAKDTSLGGWDARMQLGDEPFEPGTERRVGFVFLTAVGLKTIKEARRFYLWDSHFVGEADVVG